jgi:hypothetical protein
LDRSGPRAVGCRKMGTARVVVAWRVSPRPEARGAGSGRSAFARIPTTGRRPSVYERPLSQCARSDSPVGGGLRCRFPCEAAAGRRRRSRAALRKKRKPAELGAYGSASVCLWIAKPSEPRRTAAHLTTKARLQSQLAMLCVRVRASSLVGRTGLEPVTSGLSSRRSPS